MLLFSSPYWILLGEIYKKVCTVQIVENGNSLVCLFQFTTMMGTGPPTGDIHLFWFTGNMSGNG